jgi:hypothetical protein
LGHGCVGAGEWGLSKVPPRTIQLDRCVKLSSQRDDRFRVIAIGYPPA